MGAVYCAFAVNFLIFTKQNYMQICCLICFSALWKSCIYRMFCCTCIYRQIKSDNRKTADDMILGITNISATIFMCFKRLENFIYKTNILTWATYNNLWINKTSWGNRNYWPQKHNRYISCCFFFFFFFFQNTQDNFTSTCTCTSVRYMRLQSD